MKGFIQALIAAVLLATVGPFVKLIGDDVPIMTIVFLRSFIGFLTLLIICPLVDPKVFEVKKSDWKNYILIGFLMAFGFSLFVAANLYTTVANAILIDSTFIFFVIPLAALILKEKITKEKMIAILIAFIGLLALNPISTGGALGNILAFASAINFAVLMVYMRFEDRNHTIGTVMWFLLFASVFLLPFIFIYGFGETQSNILWILGIGILSTGLAYFFLNKSLENIDSETVSLVTLIFTPIITISIGIFILGEGLTWQVGAGACALILAGIYLSRHLATAPVKPYRIKLHHAQARPIKPIGKSELKSKLQASLAFLRHVPALFQELFSHLRSLIRRISNRNKE